MSTKLISKNKGYFKKYLILNIHCILSTLNSNEKSLLEYHRFNKASKGIFHKTEIKQIIKNSKTSDKKQIFEYILQLMNKEKAEFIDFKGAPKKPSFLKNLFLKLDKFLQSI